MQALPTNRKVPFADQSARERRSPVMRVGARRSPGIRLKVDSSAYGGCGRWRSLADSWPSGRVALNDALRHKLPYCGERVRCSGVGIPPREEFVMGFC